MGSVLMQYDTNTVDPLVAKMWGDHKQQKTSRPVPGVKQPVSALPGFGPGTVLKQLVASLGIDVPANCSCNGRAATMDKIGVEGCRKRRNEIAGWLKDSRSNLDFKTMVRVAWRYLSSPIFMHVNPVFFCESLVDEAINRAEIALENKHLNSV